MDPIELEVLGLLVEDYYEPWEIAVQAPAERNKVVNAVAAVLAKEMASWFTRRTDDDPVVSLADAGLKAPRLDDARTWEATPLDQRQFLLGITDTGRDEYWEARATACPNEGDGGADTGTPAFEVLAWCVDDFTSLATVFSLASKTPDDFNERKEATLSVIRLLVGAGFVRVGEMSSDVSGLAYWRGDMQAVLERLTALVVELVSAPTPEVNVWLHATEKGRRHFHAH